MLAWVLPAVPSSKPIVRQSAAVHSAWSRELPPVSENGAAYVTVRNAGHQADTLVRVETPVAARAEVHEHVHEGGMMKMRPVESVPIAAGDALQMGPGGTHIMLMELARPLRAACEARLGRHLREQYCQTAAPSLRIQSSRGAGQVAPADPA